MNVRGSLGGRVGQTMSFVYRFDYISLCGMMDSQNQVIEFSHPDQEIASLLVQTWASVLRSWDA
jgi:hypothetical protein